MRLLFLLLTLFGPKLLFAKVYVRAPEHYCKVSERHFSERFNFLELSSDNDYVIRHDRDVALRVQMCKQLNQKCKNEDGYSVCLSRNGHEFGIGKEPPDVIVEFGEIKFKYTGDQCDKAHNYTINITMICDYGVKDGSGMTLFVTGYNECDFNLDWRTQYACTTERKQMKCNVEDKTGHYDLSSLTNLSNNYEVFINDTYSIILNICHSVLYGPNTCKASHGACLVDKTAKQTLSAPLGEPVDNLYYNPEDKSLSLTYEGGRMCNFPHTKETHIKTTITFLCDLSATGTLPEYIGGMEQCHYNVTWKTAAACSEQALHAKSLEKQSLDLCTVKNPLSDEVFNLRPLMNKEFSVKYPGMNDIYKFSICSPLSNTSCKSGSGACRLHKSISGGMVNSQITWKESGFYLNYTNGDLCYKNIQRYTIIEFYCGEKEDFEIDEKYDLCYDVIKMSTNLVCPKKKKSCETYGKEMNFKDLTRENSTYFIKFDDLSEYHINVCASVKRNLNCNGGAICKTKLVNGKRTVVNLGYYVESPILTTDRSAVLIYNNGSICEEDKNKKIESSISFLCDINANEGNPVFKKYQNCTYYFDWKTRIACGKVEGYLNKNCTLTNDLGDHRSLTVLSGPGSSFQNIKKFNEEHKHYMLSFCNQHNECNGTFICDDKKNYGSEISVLFDYTEDLIELKFTKGSKCSDGSVGESTFIMICKEDYSINGIDLIYEEKCRVDFEWRTNLICKSSQITIPRSFDQLVVEKETSSSLSGGEIAIIAIVILLLLFAIGYFQNAARRTHFIDMITNSTARNRDRVRYSRVNTMEEVHLLVNASDPTVIDSDSDDDLLEA